MPSALETLMKILRLEREQGYRNTAVIGGLGAYASKWQADAHSQARRPEHHALIDDLVVRMRAYDDLAAREDRHQAVKYMIDRITGRVKPEGQAPPAPAQPLPDQPEHVTAPPPHPEPAPEPSPAPLASQAPPARPAAPDRPGRHEREKRQGKAPSPRREEPSRRREARPGPKTGREEDASSNGESVPGVRIDARESMGLEFGVADAGSTADTRPEDPAFYREPTRPRPRRRPRRAQDPAEAVTLLRGLAAPVTVIDRVGVRMAEKLARLGIHTVGDLLYHVPRRYDDYTRLLPVGQIKPGEAATLIGMVQNSRVIKGRGGRQLLQVTVDDGTAALSVFFFGQPYLQKQLRRGVQIVCSGKTELYLGKLAMSNPEWELLEHENLHTRAIVPVYPLTRDLTGRTMRRILKPTVEYWSGHLPDYLPESVQDRAEMVDLGWALRQIHFPENWDYLEYARERLAFDELFVLQTAMMARRRAWQKEPGVPQPVPDAWVETVVAHLPFALTGAQRRALEEIRGDMARPLPMNRLLQGDVGSGKTVVALLAMLIAIQNGGQIALMAPTSILAEQHFQSLTRLLATILPDQEIAVRLLTGATPSGERQETLSRLADGTVSILVGTHALIQPDITFANLTLVVVDEQHRFGVSQRGALRSKGGNPHLLVMTATPIPRTLALTLHADLDLSVIDEMPSGRTPVETHLLSNLERERAYGFIDHQVAKGRQAFIVYPLVDTDEVEDETRAAVVEYDRLRHEVFPRRRLDLLHGRLRPDEKEAVMARFKAGQTDILVSTSVIEVGIDIPNATVILIEGANRFGLAQLHQFRGRVGRGEYPSYCLLIGDTETEEARRRLEAMAGTTDGFALAEIDFQMRGAGDLLGTRQSGQGMLLRFGGQLNPPLVALAQREARTIYEEDPDLTLPEHHLLAERVALWRSAQTDLS